MTDILVAQIRESRARLSKLSELKSLIPQTREEADKLGYRVRGLVSCINKINEEIEALESLTPVSVIASLLGQQQSKLAKQRDELEGLHNERETSERQFQKSQDKVHILERQLGQLGDAQAQFDALCQQRQAELLEHGGETAELIKNLSEWIEYGKDQARALETAMRSGQHMLSRLDTMTRALGRGRSKFMAYSPAGVIGFMLNSAVARHGSSPANHRVREGLSQFARDVGNVDLSSDTELDIELRRLTTVLQELRNELSGNYAGKTFCNMNVTLPVIEKVQQTLGHLRDKHDRCKQMLSEHLREQTELIEVV